MDEASPPRNVGCRVSAPSAVVMVSQHLLSVCVRTGQVCPRRRETGWTGWGGGGGLQLDPPPGFHGAGGPQLFYSASFFFCGFGIFSWRFFFTVTQVSVGSAVPSLATVSTSLAGKVKESGGNTGKAGSARVAVATAKEEAGMPGEGRGRTSVSGFSLEGEWRDGGMERWMEGWMEG